MPPTHKPIIVTGAAGFIGRRVLARLVGAGHSVIAVDRVDAPDELPEGVPYHQSPLETPEDLMPSDVDVTHGFVLVHLAWNMKRGTLFHQQTDSVNLLARLLDYWTDKGLITLVGMGSAEEYGARSGTIRETDPPVFPLSPYGWAKRSAHLLASSWAARQGRNLIWLRPFVVYGEGQGGDMLLPYAIRMAHARKRAEFTDGLQERDFVHVDDVAAAIVRAVTQAPEGIHEINLGYGQPVRVRDVLEEIARLTDSQSLFHLGARPRRPGEPEIQAADIAAARGLLNWTPTVSWREGVRRCVAREEGRGKREAVSGRGENYD